jgi:hypothetical protein
MKPEIIERVLERDGHECQECYYDEELHIHHICPSVFGGTDKLDNLITLCKTCHRKKHSGNWRLKDFTEENKFSKVMITKKNGSSVLVVIPTEYGIKPKTPILFRKEGEKIILRPLIK